MQVGQSGSERFISIICNAAELEKSSTFWHATTGNKFCFIRAPFCQNQGTCLLLGQYNSLLALFAELEYTLFLIATSRARISRR
jgi:hypothetical protein